MKAQFFIMTLAVFVIGVTVTIVRFHGVFKLKRRPSISPPRDEMHVAIALCGERIGDALVMAESLALTASNPVVLHAFVEKKIQNQFKSALGSWPRYVKRNIQLEINDIFLPTRVVAGIPPDFWRRHFTRCIYQRLFLPEYFPDLSKLLYFDADTIFLSPVDDLWDQTTKFDTKQIIGMSIEQNPGGTGFYTNFKRHPIYGEMGLNSGTILYDLGKINRTQFLIDIKTVFDGYGPRLILADQGIFNVMFHFHPEKLFEISCVWNYRSDYCQKSTCKDAQETGARLIHGNRRIFYSRDINAFSAAHSSFRKVTCLLFVTIYLLHVTMFL